MAKTPNRYAEIDAVYAKLPGFDCQGKCQESCGPISMSRLEWQRILESAGDKAKVLTADLTCPLLNRKTGKCTVYEIRPLVCRLFGMVKRMQCPWGCKPLFWVSEEQVDESLKELARISS